MNRYSVVLFILLFCPSGLTADSADKPIERGRYLVIITGCNDCHTAGYAMNEGKIPQDDWLKGDSLGWRGPWGTTYPVNLRLYMSRLDESDWIELARNIQPRPPMPWFNLREMTDRDLAAVYRFVRSLGPVGDPAPAFVPPDKEPNGPYFLFPAPPAAGDVPQK